MAAGNSACKLGGTFELSGEHVYGWYRRKITIPEDIKGKDIILGIGRIDDVDETFVNGTKIGQLGSFPPIMSPPGPMTASIMSPQNLLKGDGTDVVAVRVFDGEGGGGLYAKDTAHVRSGPFDSKSEGGASAGFTVGGIGWYRKTFNLPNSLKEKKLSVVFDGVYMNCQIWVNGNQIGEHPYGYTTFEVDITPYVHFGNQPNVLAVKVDTSGRHTRCIQAQEFTGTSG